MSARVPGWVIAAPFCYDRRFDFDASTDEVWAAFARPDRFPTWWPWLRQCDGDGLVPGTTTRCVVRAPLPYTLRFDVTVEDVVPGRLVAGLVTGDLVGPARLELRERPPGSTVRLVWSLEVQGRMLDALATVARPALTWAHDRIVERGRRDFARRALGEPPQPNRRLIGGHG